MNVKRDKKIILLGKKTFWWRVKVVLYTIFWITSFSSTKKTWSEYKYGLIKHEHVWDTENPEIDQFSTCFPCKHHGCNFIDLKTIKYS